MLDGAAEVLLRSNKLSQAVIVTLLRASCCGHDPIMVRVVRGSTDREELRTWPAGPAKTRAKKCRPSWRRARHVTAGWPSARWGCIGDVGAGRRAASERR